LLQKAFSFYIQSSLHVAFSVISLLAIAFFEFGWPVNGTLFVFVFCNTLLTYNFIKYATAATSYYHVKGTRLKSIRALSFVCGLVGVYCCAFLPISALWAALGLGLLSFLYVIPVTSKSKSFRNIKYVKSIIVAAVWASVVVVLPIFTLDIEFLLDHFVFWGVMYCWVLATLIPFEIRDLPWDDPSIRTLPQILGVKGAKGVAYVAIGCVFVLELWRHGWRWSAMTDTGLICVVVLSTLWYTKPVQSKYFASFWVESLAILWFVINRLAAA
jgi:hypothetical protein